MIQSDQKISVLLFSFLVLFLRPSSKLPADNQLNRAKAIEKVMKEVQKEQAKRKVAFGLRTSGMPVGTESSENLRNLPAGSGLSHWIQEMRRTVQIHWNRRWSSNCSTTVREKNIQINCRVTSHKINYWINIQNLDLLEKEFWDYRWISSSVICRASRVFFIICISDNIYETKWQAWFHRKQSKGTFRTDGKRNT